MLKDLWHNKDILLRGTWIAEWYHTWLWTLVCCAMLWAVSLSLSEDKLFFGPKHNIYAFLMILFGLFDLILLFFCQICHVSLWNRKLKINKIYLKKDILLSIFGRSRIRTHRKKKKKTAKKITFTLVRMRTSKTLCRGKSESSDGTKTSSTSLSSTAGRKKDNPTSVTRWFVHFWPFSTELKIG